MRFFMLACLLVGLTNPSFGEPLDVVAWNLESGDSDLGHIKWRVARMKGVDIWGFSESYSTQTVDGARVSWPENLASAAAFIIPHRNGIWEEELFDYQASIDEVEKAAGINFTPFLDDDGYTERSKSSRWKQTLH